MKSFAVILWPSIVKYFNILSSSANDSLQDEIFSEWHQCQGIRARRFRWQSKTSASKSDSDRWFRHWFPRRVYPADIIQCCDDHSIREDVFDQVTMVVALKALIIPRSNGCIWADVFGGKHFRALFSSLKSERWTDTLSRKAGIFVFCFRTIKSNSSNYFLKM